MTSYPFTCSLALIDVLDAPDEGPGARRLLPGVEALLAGGQELLAVGPQLAELYVPGDGVVDQEHGRVPRLEGAQRHQHLH